MSYHNHCKFTKKTSCDQSFYLDTIKLNTYNRGHTKESYKDWGALGETGTYLDIWSRSHSQCQIGFYSFCTLSSVYPTLHRSGWRLQTRWSSLSATQSKQLVDWCGRWCFLVGRRGSWSSVHSPWLKFIAVFLFQKKDVCSGGWGAADEWL